ncbi:MAG: hypothetical protein QXG39_06770 [Candidatus Aenigmatarchaeota archaeon]
MKLDKAFIFSVVVLFVFSSARAIRVTIEEGSIKEIEPQELLVNFGMLTGTLNFKLGNYRWPAKEIWLVPPGTSPSYFKSNSTYLEIPENITFTTCKTSVYYNATYGFAFKGLAEILPNGTFCILAYNGTYDLVAKY